MTKRVLNTFTDLGWSFVILLGLLLTGAGCLLVAHLGGLR
jgi:hypothetical protein